MVNCNCLGGDPPQGEHIRECLARQLAEAQRQIKQLESALRSRTSRIDSIGNLIADGQLLKAQILTKKAPGAKP